MVNKQEQTGITLVALVITIVVLLILVSVTIKTLIDSQIVDVTKNIVNAYNEAVEDEMSNKYLNYINEKITEYT